MKKSKGEKLKSVILNYYQDPIWASYEVFGYIYIHVYLTFGLLSSKYLSTIKYIVYWKKPEHNSILLFKFKNNFIYSKITSFTQKIFRSTCYVLDTVPSTGYREWYLKRQKSLSQWNYILVEREKQSRKTNKTSVRWY